MSDCSKAKVVEILSFSSLGMKVRSSTFIYLCLFLEEFHVCFIEIPYFKAE